jgi:hypothetical protein
VAGTGYGRWDVAAAGWGANVQDEDEDGFEVHEDRGPKEWIKRQVAGILSIHSRGRLCHSLGSSAHAGAGGILRWDSHSGAALPLAMGYGQLPRPICGAKDWKVAIVSPRWAGGFWWVGDPALTDRATESGGPLGLGGD